jgi:SAM-dependent methyltransferase
VNVFDEFEARPCPVCGEGPDNATLFLEESFNPARLDSFSFASRKAPEFMSYRLLRCTECSTVYAAAAPPTEALATAYAKAAYDSAEEAALAADTYEAALRPMIASLAQRARALEIGTGTGVFLERLRRGGFVDVVGIEPSKAAIDAAEAEIRPFIREGIFVEKEFSPESFDFICCFQTLEHVSGPKELVESCLRLLRPGGILACVTHDYRAPINRLLGRRSPIIDIEHLQLFCGPSLKALLANAGFVLEKLSPLVNRYPLRYWARLSPLPEPIKKGSTQMLALLGLASVRVGLNVGNLVAVGRKPYSCARVPDRRMNTSA